MPVIRVQIFGVFTDQSVLPTAPRPHALPKWEKYTIFRMPVMRWNFVFRVPFIRAIIWGVFSDQFALPTAPRPRIFT